MSYTPYSPDNIQSMFFRWYNVKPYVYDPTTFTLMEMIGQAIEKVNEVIKETNDMGMALLAFENYVLTELQKYDQKIADEVLKIINQKIEDGTLADFIQSLFDGVNQSIENLDTKVNQNKQQIDDEIMSINNSLTALNYEESNVNIAITPSQFIYNVGENINGINIISTITKGTNDIQSLKIYKNNSIINTLNNPQINEQYLDGSIITNDTEYYVEIYDGKKTITSNKIKINFVNNFYYGVINNTIDETLIKSLTSLKTLKTNLNETFSPNDQKILIAYPQIYGDLISINDDENYDMINGFTKSNINLTLNNISVPYNVYVSNFIIKDSNVNLTFEF